MHGRILELSKEVSQVNQLRSRIIQEIELLLRKYLSVEEIELLESLAEELGGYITRPWGSDDLVVKLPAGE